MPELLAKRFPTKLLAMVLKHTGFVCSDSIPVTRAVALVLLRL